MPLLVVKRPRATAIFVVERIERSGGSTGGRDDGMALPPMSKSLTRERSVVRDAGRLQTLGPGVSSSPLAEDGRGTSVMLASVLGRDRESGLCFVFGSKDPACRRGDGGSVPEVVLVIWGRVPDGAP